MRNQLSKKPPPPLSPPIALPPPPLRMAATAAAAISSSFSSSMQTLKCLRSKSCFRVSPFNVASSSPTFPSFALKSISLTSGPQRWRVILGVSADVAQEETTAAAEGEAEAESAVGSLETEAEAEAEAEVNTKLYFGNLPYSVDSAQLAGIIQAYGSPELIEVLYDRETGKSRGFAFVTMSNIEDCNAVIENLDGSKFMGRTLRVNLSDKPRPKEPLYPETEYKLFVGNLSWSVTADSLTQAFQEYGNVVGARVLYDGETGRSRGYGFVCYGTKEEMETALESLDGVELEGRAMRVSLAQGKRQ